jgi:hypothetical protein
MRVPSPSNDSSLANNKSIPAWMFEGHLFEGHLFDGHLFEGHFFEGAFV